MTSHTSLRPIVLATALLALPPTARADTRTTLEVEGASPETSATLDKLSFFASLVGGVHVESLKLREQDAREDRTTTLALSRLGVRGQLRGGVFIESELEVNAGPHGTSVWEGQAALQVRNQLLRYTRERLRIDVGRLTDDSSLDFFSTHVADQLLTDPYTRAPLLASGFNRGQGVLLRYEVLPGLKPGITLNAANPTSTTASLVVGGTFPPFSRFYFAAHQQVGRDASSFPSDEYHITLATPSVIYQSDVFDAQAGVQMFRINTDTSATDDQNIIGYNLRAGVRGKLADGRLAPFVNVSRVTNSMVDKNDGKRLSDQAYTGYTFSTGLDVAVRGRNGVGISYAFVRGQQGMESRTTEQYVNVGATYWLTPTTSIGARGAMVSLCVETPMMACTPEGARSVFITLRSLVQ